MSKNILGKKLLFATAHPDDESYTSAGTIHENHKAGGESFLICATLGEKGKAHLLRPLSGAELKKRRRKELEDSSRFLKIKKLFVLNFPDGKVIKNKARLYRQIRAIAKKVEPDYILSFGKDGMSGHLDHIAVGDAAKNTAQKERIPFVAFAAPPSRVKLMKKLSHTLLARRKHGKYIKKIKYAKPTLKIKIDGEVKTRAVSFHKSQLGRAKPLAHFPRAVRNEWLRYEYFRQH